MSWSHGSININGRMHTIYIYNTTDESYSLPDDPTQLLSQDTIFYFPDGVVDVTDVIFQNTYASNWTLYYVIKNAVIKSNETDDKLHTKSYKVERGDSNNYATIVYISIVTCINCYMNTTVLAGYPQITTDDSWNLNTISDTQLIYRITKDTQTSFTLDCTRLYIEKDACLTLKLLDGENELTLNTAWLQIDGTLRTDSLPLVITPTTDFHVASENTITITNIGTDTKGTISNTTIHCMKNSVLSNLILENVIYEFVDRYTREVRNCTFLTSTVFSGSNLTITNTDFKEGFRSDVALNDIIPANSTIVSQNMLIISGPLCNSNNNPVVV